MTNTNRPIRRALVSVFHKEGIEVLAEAFVKAGTEVVSTGSTAKKLAELGVKVTEVSDVTGFPECLDGRVKTLHPYIHAGILADMTNPEHAKQLEEFGIKPFDLVVVNLYPFADTVRSGANEADTIEKIDIGGPSMVRGAAKNHATVAIVTDPADYALVASRVADGTGFSLDERKWLAAKAFAHTAAYDATINEWTAKHWPKPASLDAVEVDKDDQGTEVDSAKFPAQFTRTWDRAHTLRYGENSHQQAALYIDPLNQTGFAHAEQLGGKPMSYNNYVDADAAWRTVWDMAPAIAVAVVKHNNPCGLAIGATAAEAHKKAHACDPMSAYGGVIACNSKVTLDLINAVGDDPDAWKLVAGEAADADTLKDLVFAWRAIRCVKSNAILLAHDQATVGIGMGQVNRVDSCHLAVERANTLADGADRATGAVAASDAFFPFADGAQVLIDAGVKAIVQPGGSIRDEEVIEAAKKAGVTMYLTGTRHFFH